MSLDVICVFGDVRTCIVSSRALGYMLAKCAKRANQTVQQKSNESDQGNEASQEDSSTSAKSHGRDEGHERMKAQHLFCFLILGIMLKSLRTLDSSWVDNKKHARGKYKGGVCWVVYITHRVAAPRRGLHCFVWLCQPRRGAAARWMMCCPGGRGTALKAEQPEGYSAFELIFLLGGRSALMNRPLRVFSGP